MLLVLFEGGPLMTAGNPATPRRRPRILFAWELGENLGHASKITEIVRALNGRAQVTVAAQRPDAISAMAGEPDQTLCFQLQCNY